MPDVKKLWGIALLIMLAACGVEAEPASGDRISALCNELYPMITEYDDAMVDHFAVLEDEASRLGIESAVESLNDASDFMVDPQPGQDESDFYQALVGISDAFADAGYERCANLAASSELAPEGSDLEAIERNRRLWDEQDPSDYVLRLSTGQREGSVRSYAIEIADGEPVRAFLLGFGQELPLDDLADLPITVETAFELIRGEPGSGVRMDHQVGNPVFYNAGDSWFHWEVASDAGEVDGTLGPALEALSQLQESSYWLTLEVDCSCPEDEMSPISMQSVDGEVVATQNNPDYDGVQPEHIPATVPELVGALSGNTFAHDVIVEWEDDETLELTIDPLEGTGGEEVKLVITVSDSPPERGVGQIADMHCGALAAPLSQAPPALGNTDDPDLDLALEWFAGNEEGRFWVDTVEWSIWGKTDDEMILYGKTEDGYADATFVKEGEGWRPTGWGGCHWRVTVEGWGVAEWRVNAPAETEATTLVLAATERNCANGEAPEGRDIESVVWETEGTVTIFIFVEPVSGSATCPGNPEFAWTVELDSPLGTRQLFDGSEVPPVERAAG